MQRAAWILGVVLIVALLGAWFYWISGIGAPTGAGSQTQTPDFNQGRTGSVTPGVSTSTPGGQQSDTTMTLNGQGGTVLAVNNFLTNPEVTTDAAHKDAYALAGGLSPNSATTPYSIVYFAESQSFVVTLLQEPLGSNRHLAEAQLQEYLELSQGDMCFLNYLVGTPEYVSEQYSGTNLGFSFCPGATPLP